MICVFIVYQVLDVEAIEAESNMITSFPPRLLGKSTRSTGYTAGRAPHINLSILFRQCTSWRLSRPGATGSFVM